MTLAAVSDAGPLIHLAEIDSLELLATFDTLLVPETVYKEVDAGAFFTARSHAKKGRRFTRKSMPEVLRTGWPTSRTNSSKPMKAESELKNWMPENAPRLR